MATTSRSADDDADNFQRDDMPSSAAVVKHRGWVYRMWHKLGLDVLTMQKMLKVSIPPTIAVAMFQSSVVAKHFLTDGYFIALLAFAMLPILPRTRYIRLLLVSIITICIACCFSLLAVWTALQARRHTTKAGDETVYNSSQAAVLAVWLFALTYAINSAKAVFPQDQIAFVLMGIFEIAILTSGVDFTTMDQAMNVTMRILEAFLTGMGLSCGVSFLVFPQSCRDVFFQNLSGYLQALENVLNAQIGYVRSLEHEDPWFPTSVGTTATEHEKHDTALANLYVVASKVRAEQSFAQQEVAFAKLSGDDLGPLVDSAMRVMPALSGLGFIFQLLAQVQKERGYTEGAEDEKHAVQKLQAMIQVIREPCEKISFVMVEGIEHVQTVLELKRSQQQSQARFEAKTGTTDFATWYDEQTANFKKVKEAIARLWYEQNGVELPQHFTEIDLNALDQQQANGQLGGQLRPFTIIYIVYLLFAASRELSELIAYVDSKAKEGALEQRHLILPTFQRLQRFVGSLLHHKGRLSPSVAVDGADGDLQHRQKKQRPHVHSDPEHLPATSWHENVGNFFRKIPRFLRSNPSIHGFRVACAVMSIAVGFYVRTSSRWFSSNRWLWGMMAIQLSMTQTAGLSFFMFICRILGTILAMVASFIVYYIVDGETAGVIVFLWIYFLIMGYLLLKFPFYTGVFMVSLFASIVMVANVLQDKKLGFARVEALGQAAHEEYLMAPERLGIVSAGVAIAYFWTIFPYPISEHSALRHNLADTLFTLASYHAMVVRTLTSRARGNETLATRNQNQLAKRRMKQFTKLQFLFAQLRQHLTYTKWQIVLGGKFPTKQYAELIRLCEEVCVASSVIGYASSSFVGAMEEARGSGKGPSKWLTDFQLLLESVDVVSDQVTAAILMLSNHMANGNPFPPHLPTPDSSSLMEKVDELNSELMTVSHIMEPAYTAFVTIVMAGKAIRRALTRQLEISKQLVGVLEFSSLIDMESQPLMLDDMETTGGLA